MRKYWLALLFFTICLPGVYSQTLFTYGPYKSDAAEFIRAFNKNNQQASGPKAKAMQEYLDLYINSRLKIQEAYDRGYDTLPQIRAEVENLRNQIVENYMSDPEAINRLTREAFQRSQKDIHTAHIFISFTNSAGVTDTAAARGKLEEVTSRLAKGENFLAVAQQFSDDPSAKTNKGDIGYITVFILPYELETLVYNTPAGKYSKPYASKAGYHIFKNLGERKALGAIKLQHILLAFQPGIDEAGKQKIARQADSLYQQIIKGADFGRLAAQYSSDYVSAANMGNLPDITVGEYEPDFEKIVWGLPRNGAVSKPFATSYGYHIVKRISLTPVVSNANDEANKSAIQQKVRTDDRWKTARDHIYTQVKTKAGMQRSGYTDASLWAFSDSALDGKPSHSNLRASSPLFTIGKKEYTAADWLNYVRGNRFKADRSGVKTYAELMGEFTKGSMYQYYRDNLEDFNPEFRSQMTEFRDGNLFFEIMQQEVWNKTQADSAALLSLYEKNKSNYKWKPGADAVIFFCSDAATANTLAAQLRKNPSEWRTEVAKVSERVVSDSGRYEWPQVPGVGKMAPKAGSLTNVVVNETDRTSSFAYILDVHAEPSIRSFNEARGLVMNDYQVLVEAEWMKALRKKYPVNIDKNVLARISK